MSPQTFLIAPLLLFILLLPQSLANDCKFFCRFRLCSLQSGKPVRKGLALLLRNPGTSFTPYVCNPGGRLLGRIRKTGEAQVLNVAKNPLPISEYKPAPRANFPANFFRLFPIRFTRGLQGVGTARASRTQLAAIDNRCVILPIREFDILNGDGTVRKTLRAPGRSACVSFVARSPAVLVELAWDSSDDLDLDVNEPGRGRVNAFSPMSDAGKLDVSASGGVCASSGFGTVRREAVIYDFENADLVKNGQYEVSVTHFTNCGFGPTNWFLTVRVADRRVVQRQGVSNKESGKLITTVRFKVNL